MGNDSVVIRVWRLADGVPTGFRVTLVNDTQTQTFGVGRLRWTPNGKHLVFIALNDRGVCGWYVQEFESDRDTSANRRAIVPFDSELKVESFGISPDGRT